MSAEAVVAEGVPVTTEREATPAAWFALIVFSLVTLFAYVDRSIFALLAEPIRKSMGFTDVQLGLLQGTGLALFAGLGYYPIGWLADRFDRRLVMVLGIAVWSSAVVACGLAQGFWSLFAASALVGAGEASLAPVFYSMIPELFRGNSRQLANSIFGVTATSVGGIAIIVSGQLPGLAQALKPMLPGSLGQLEVWRLSFFAAAAPAPLMILAVLGVRMGGPRTKVVKQAELPILPFLIRERRTLLPLILGTSIAAFGGSALMNWFAVILMRYFGQTPATVGSALGVITLVCTAGGFLLSLAIVRMWGKRLGVLLPVRGVWLSYVSSAIGSAALIFAPSAGVVFVIVGVAAIVSTATNLLTPTALQSLAPRPLRGRFIAIFFMLILFFAALSGPAVGFVSDQLKGAPRSLLVAAGAVAAIAQAIAILLVSRSERGYRQTVERSARIDLEEAAAG